MTVTIRIPARYATVRPDTFGGVEVLIDHLTLDQLTAALCNMEHNDTDPGERRMNADQCRDALLREMLLGWKLEDLVGTQVPVVNEAIGEIIGLRRRLDAADRELDKFRPLEFLLKRDGTPAMDQAIEKVRAQADQIATLRRERDEARARLDEHNAGKVPFRATPTPGAQA